jgi:nucleotide-binding universal stress UspA family protein
MTYKTFMIELTVGESNAALLEASAELARRFQASVIGIAGCAPLSLTYGDGFASGEAFQDDRNELQTELLAAVAEFEEAFQHLDSANATTPVTCYSAVVYETLARFVSEHVCEADLLITSGKLRGTTESNRCANIGDLLMELGRPMLLLPRGAKQQPLERALIAWNDTREARRAIADALPLLKLARHVVLAQIVAPDQFSEAISKLTLVAQWLRSHGIASESITLPSTGEDPTALRTIIDEQHIDLVVAGAYGHSRLREWVLGGVTRDLLTHDSHCSLLSH